ncbi:ABC transporter ATP-binding protein [Kosmotoga pacifica]|nr:ABC transporter ATP-binding protein [Kosmotoga pacifica]
MHKKDVLLIEGVSKLYKESNTQALKDVSMVVKKGMIHALIGENAAGKSTLVSIIAGLIPKDSGEIFFNGERLNFSSPKEAYKKGIALVHQHFMLVDELSVLENIILGIEPSFLGFLNKKKALNYVKFVEKEYGLSVDPFAYVGNLSVAEKQYVEILRALIHDPEILILDEPTSVLTEKEVDELFKILVSLKEKGKTIIYISHKLPEIKQIADRITVLRKGMVVGEFDSSELSTEEIAHLMIGETASLKPIRTSSAGNILLSIKELRAGSVRTGIRVNGVSFDIRKGEIVAITGVAGNGQEELIHAIFGLVDIISGTVVFLDENITGLKPKELRKRKIAFVPSDRTSMGCCLKCTVVENMVMPYIHAQRIKLLNWQKLTSQVYERIQKNEISVPGLSLPVRYLSGGNLQKLIISRELAYNPKLLLVSDPTRGLDTKSATEVQNLLLEFKSRGSVLMVSTDLDEVLNVADRILVMSAGRIVFQTINDDSVSKEILGRYMISGDKSEREVTGVNHETNT